MKMRRAPFGTRVDPAGLRLAMTAWPAKELMRAWRKLVLSISTSVFALK